MTDSLLDHLVYATPDLLATVDRFAEATGIRPVEGGRHEAWGTRNYLVGLGGTTYLEFIGPDPEASEVSLFDVSREQLLTWAIHPTDLESALAAARAAGADLGEIFPGSRTTPAGELLSWRVTGANPRPYEGVVPFLIDWADSPHPALSLPVAELVDFQGTHPQPAEVQTILQALGAELTVVEGPPALAASVRGPAGTFHLS
ncbi:VOC family protein [Kribbella antibiotica]|uniref:VOC family protein n=1 Tax=Kribbella antibiotica TaxID=190195 RepID=A0A4R4ZLB8_9ACTN|nr:VOC family protein [Kribbella antibiotica]TDD58654.1 VOC family protein [Kribbella antibiotica]